MAKVLTDESNYAAIANAIRAKKGVETTYRPGDMAGAISSIETANLDTLSVNANGTYTPTSPKNGFSQVDVNVPNSYSASDEGKVVSEGELVAQGSRTIIRNGTYDTTLVNEIIVDVSGGGSSIIEDWDFTSATPLVGTIRGLELTSNSGMTFNNGAVFNDVNDYLKAGVYASFNGVTIEVDVASMNLTSGTHRRFIMPDAANGFIYRSNGKWAVYFNNWEESTETDGAFFNNSVVKIHIDSDGSWHIYKDGVLWWEPTIKMNLPSYGSDGFSMMIGSSGSQSINNAVITGMRVY